MSMATSADGLAQRLKILQGQLPPRARLLAVSKGQPAARLREAVGLGLRSFGESRLQEAQAKQDDLAELEPLDWHFIGQLQANKARGVLRHFGTIHSVDRFSLAERLQRIAAEEQLSPPAVLSGETAARPRQDGIRAPGAGAALAPLCWRWSPCGPWV